MLESINLLKLFNSKPYSNSYQLIMEFKFDLHRFCKPNKEGLVLLLPQLPFRSAQICEIIDKMGRASTIAQNLPSTITTSSRFFTSSDNKIYLKIDSNKVVGILKIGTRKLFYTNELGRMTEITPLCLLDFYVHESCQRSGYGKELYEFMLKSESTSASKIAIDKPSQKLLSFMRKYYSLSDYIPQNNNYVIYKQYFSGGFKEENKKPETGNSGNEGFFDGFTRKTGHSQVTVRRGANDVYSKEIENYLGQDQHRKIYVAVPPWAVNNNFSVMSTSYSQYGARIRK